MTRTSWLLPLLCFGSAVVSAALMLSYVLAAHSHARPSGWLFMAAVAVLGILAGGAHYTAARQLGAAIAWGLGITLLSAALFVGVLTSGFGS